MTVDKKLISRESLCLYLLRINWFKFILSLVLIVFLSNMPDFFVKNPWVPDIMQVPEKFLLFGGQSRKEKV